MSRFTEGQLKAMGLTMDKDGTYSKKKSVNQKAKVIKKPQIATESVGEFDKNKKVYVFRWAGKDISLNAWYSTPHWTVRNKHKHEWHEFFKSMLITREKICNYKITLTYNSRLDPSNCITMIKLCEDMLQEEGIIENDNKKFCAGVHLIPDLTMKQKCYIIKVEEV